MRMWVEIVLLAAIGWGCDDGDASVAPLRDGAAIDANLGDGSTPDGALPDTEIELDAALPDSETPDVARLPDGQLPDVPDAMWLPLDPALLPSPAAAFHVGAARRRMPVPVGIGTCGFGPGGPPNPTPFSNIYAGTRGVHTHPDVRVVVFEAGEGRVILVRTDTVGVTATLRRAIVAELAPRYGDRVDQQLVFAGTHTHSGPGRLIEKPLWRLIQDDFFPEFFVSMRDTIVAAVDEAMDDLQPAQVGHGLAMTDRVHNDRRCENPVEDEPDMPFIRVDDLEGRTRAVVVFHAVHGTVLGNELLMLSQDVPGGIEAKLAENFDHPVMVMFINGAAADMGVDSPDQPRDPEAPNWEGAFWRVEGVGQVAADAVRAAWDVTEMKTEGVIHSRTARVPINRQVLGYGPEFRYEFGAVYCGSGAEERCFGEPAHENLARACIPFPDEENSAPKQAPITVGQIGERLFLTAPGEFSTALGRRAREAAVGLTGLTDVVVMGYAQEYMGYSLAEDDWMQGGYESSGALWGPKQGDHLTDAMISVARSYGDPRIPLAFDDQPLEDVPGPYNDPPFPVMPSAEAPIGAEVDAVYPSDVVIEFVFIGGDPWLGNPVVTLEQGTENGFEPARGPDGRVFDSDGYVMSLTLATNPSYEDEEATSRTFAWTVWLPALRAYGGGPDLTAGNYRLVARGRTLLDDTVQDYEIASTAFTVQGQ